MSAAQRGARTMQTRSARLMEEDGRLLASLLEVEERHYRRLLRLA